MTAAPPNANQPGVWTPNTWRDQPIRQVPAYPDLVKLDEMERLIQSERLLTFESLSNMQSKRPPVFAGSIGAVVTKEAMPRFAALTNEIIGPRGQLALGSEWAPIDVASGGPEAWFRSAFRNHAGGTAQVKRMVLATRGLGLSR